MKESEANNIYKIRHSLSHVLAQAVLEMYPNAKLAFGPPIETGCYYDFLFDEPISPQQFPEIESIMRRIIDEDQVFISSSMEASDALNLLNSKNQPFKAEYCAELMSRGEVQIEFYENGPFVDMCAGPHIVSTSQIPKDAYWRGSEKNPQLTRIYCLCFDSKNELDDYKKNRQLSQERDHRKLGKELELFLLSEEVGPGLPLWTANGTAIRDALEDYAKEVEARAGYQRVATPHLAKEDLYYESGHLPLYASSMYPPIELEGESKYYLKPMNCPHHHMIYRARPRSYRELPIRFAEYGTVYRYEASGTLSGLLRVRSICQNDAHIYCTDSQLKDEVKATVRMTLDYYTKFRFHKVMMRFSKHDPNKSDQFINNSEAWKQTEAVMQEILDELNAEYTIGEGDAAFYGPKFDFQAKTQLGREETISTTQLDFGQPSNFKLAYIDNAGMPRMPYIIHRAPLGSHERFIAFLIEHFGGAFPTWMAPTQVTIVPVNETVLDYANNVASVLRQELVRVFIDTSDNRFNKKLRSAIESKCPNTLIIGNQEKQDNSITLRRYCTPNQETMSLEAFVNRIVRSIKQRFMDNFID
jgi:threonyl-tRNA synthetase